MGPLQNLSQARIISKISHCEWWASQKKTIPLGNDFAVTEKPSSIPLPQILHVTKFADELIMDFFLESK